MRQDGCKRESSNRNRSQCSCSKISFRISTSSRSNKSISSNSSWDCRNLTRSRCSCLAHFQVGVRILWADHRLVSLPFRSRLCRTAMHNMALPEPYSFCIYCHTPLQFQLSAQLLLCPNCGAGTGELAPSVAMHAPGAVCRWTEGCRSLHTPRRLSPGQRQAADAAGPDFGSSRIR